MEKLYKDLEEADEVFLSSGMKDMELTRNSLRRLQERLRQSTWQPFIATWIVCCVRIFPEAEKYTLQRHDERQLLTTVGPVCFTHTLFRSRKDGTCHYLLDEWMELDAQ